MDIKGFFEEIKKEYGKREIVCVAASVILALSVGAYAWFASNSLRYFFGVKPITQAYTLYLTDSKDKRPLELRTKIPPNMGSRQEVVFKVKGKASEGDIDNEEKIDYELEMNYTENLPVIYDLYKYDGSDYVLLENYSTAITSERRRQAYVDGGYNLSLVNPYNYGMYRQYYDGANAFFSMENGNPDVYKIVISWDLNKVNNPYDLTEYNKETDLIYIVAREISAGQ